MVEVVVNNNHSQMSNNPKLNLSLLYLLIYLHRSFSKKIIMMKRTTMILNLLTLYFSKSVKMIINKLQWQIKSLLIVRQNLSCSSMSRRNRRRKIRKSREELAKAKKIKGRINIRIS